MKISDTQVIFWGTSEFAIPTLVALLKEGYAIAAVVTTPDKPVGRKQLLTPPPIKTWVMKHEAWNTIPILQPEKLNEEFMLQVSGFVPDVFVVAAYGKIIPMNILALPKYGAINIHPSLLPRWRGPSPIQYTILNGDTETGVTIMKIDEKMDHGPIVTNHKSPITNHQLTYTELHDVLAKIGAELLIETLPQYCAGEIKPIPQDDSRATYSKLLKKEDGHIDWTHSAEEIENMVRALSPWPGVYTFWEREGKRLKINILRARSLTDNQQPTANKAAGLISKDNEKLIVQTGNGIFEIFELRIEGKKSTDAKSFLNGYPEITGKILT